MKRHNIFWRKAALIGAALLIAFGGYSTTHAYAQGVTTGSIGGKVTDGQNPVPAADVTARHEPSGTTYHAITRADGGFTIPNMRVGGPYSVTVTYGKTGTAFAPKTMENVTVNLGISTDLTITVQAINISTEVVVQGQSDPVFASSRTGAATTLSRDDIAALPTISGRLDSMTRLTPQSSSGGSLVGQDTRLNNITVDGSYFNNSFGLGSSPGDRTGVAPIPLAAVEQIQVSLAPFDVRQGNFVGGAVNTVTRSGTNKFRGSVYHRFRNEGMVGTKAKDLAVNPGTFTYGETGEWVSGPVIKDKLFFFQSYEQELTTQPSTTFLANKGGETVQGSTTRVLASDLDTLKSFLINKLKYDPGIYTPYDFKVPGKRLLAKADYNIGSRNKLAFRYNLLNSSTDVLESNSSSLGKGNRRSNLQSLNFSGSNYTILENIRSGVGQLNTILSNTMSNDLTIGYTTQDESRGAIDKLFPTVDIMAGDNTTYAAFGSEPFTPNNELRYQTFQLQDSLTKYNEKHTWTVGVTFEKYHSENVFFPGQQSVYVYNTLADFYTDANDYLANPNRTKSPVTLNLFQVRYLNVPGVDKPIQPLDVIYAGAYAQDEWSLMRNFKITAGIRFDVARFGNTGYANSNADSLTFRDENGQGVKYSSAKLPDPKLLWSPRVGFNWGVTKDHKTQVRGGSGIFTGPPAYVWISNQIGNTGVLTGFDQLSNTTARPFNPNPDTYKPKTTPTGAPAATYELALTDPNFKFPQVWRSNIAADRALFWGITSTTEYIYNRDVNGIYYINANLPAPQSAFTGADTRPRWVAPSGTIASRLTTSQYVANAIVMKNQNIGRSWSFAQTFSKTLKNGLYFKAAYSYGVSKNTIDPGSIALGSWSGNPISGNPNNVPIAYSSTSPAHRVFVSASYSKEYFKFGRTTVSMFWEASTIGNSSYLFSGDANGDGSTSNNDLIYIPRSTSEMNFQQYTSGGITFTAAQQAAAWDAYIAQDKYMSSHRGQYAQRGAVFFPFVNRMDLSLSQNIFHDFWGQRHAFEIRADILNFGNLLNSNWGVSQRMVNNTPLTNPGLDSNNALIYRMRAVNGKLMDHTFEQTSGLSDVYRIMLTLKYNFN
jgi:hypothetical protein